MKTYSLVISALCFSSVYAGAPAIKAPVEKAPVDCPYKMNCPREIPDCRSVMVDIYGDFLLLQPNGSAIYYGVEAFPLRSGIPTPAVSPNWQVFELQPNYTPGFEVGGKIRFSDLGTSLLINWERLYSSKHGSQTAGPFPDMIGPMFDIGPSSAAYTSGLGRVDFEFDAADLIFGQQCCVFERLYPNFYAGAGFARIKQTLTSTYANSANTVSRQLNAYSTFIGAGPQFGLDFDYRIAKGFFFTGSSSLGLVIGQSSNNATYSSIDPALLSSGNPYPNVQSTSVPDRTQVVPSFEEKMGFSYAAAFRCFRFELGVGYLAQIYLNAIQTIDMTAPQVLPSFDPGQSVLSGVYAVGFERTLSNFILSGPYISLAFDF